MSEIIIYEPADGGHVTVRLEGESLWLTQEHIADLFKRERSVITKHLRNIFKDGELVEESDVQNLHIAGSDKPVKFYNLDAAQYKQITANADSHAGNGDPASAAVATR
jgi:hypothetical protein